MGCQLFYAFIYYNGFAFFERYKVLEGGWPWEEDPDYWYLYLKPKSIAVYIINMLLITPFFFSLHEILGIPLDCNVSKEGIPTRTVFVCQIIFCMLSEDFFFHMSHRALHWKAIYPYIHKQHHEHKTTICITTNYAHPIEFIFGNALTSASGMIILGSNMHITTVWAW